MKTSDGGKENFDLVRGIFGEFISEIIKSGGGNRQYYNTEYLKIVLDRMVRKSGTDVLLHSTVTAAYRDGRKITSLDFHTVAFRISCSSAPMVLPVSRKQLQRHSRRRNIGAVSFIRYAIQ